jgi:hypothetical protein
MPRILKISPKVKIGFEIMIDIRGGGTTAASNPPGFHMRLIHSFTFSPPRSV